MTDEEYTEKLRKEELKRINKEIENLKKGKEISNELKKLAREIDKLQEKTEKELLKYIIINPTNLAANMKLIWEYFNSYNDLIFEYLEEREKNE